MPPPEALYDMREDLLEFGLFVNLLYIFQGELKRRETLVEGWWSHFGADHANQGFFTSETSRKARKPGSVGCTPRGSCNNMLL